MSGANPGTQGAGTGADIIQASRIMTPKEIKIAHARKEQKRYSSFKKQRAEREKEKLEIFRQKDLKDKHIGEEMNEAYHFDRVERAITGKGYVKKYMKGPTEYYEHPALQTGEFFAVHRSTGDWEHHIHSGKPITGSHRTIEKHLSNPMYEMVFGNPGNNGGGTDADGMHFSRRVLRVLKAAKERDKQDNPYFEKKAKELMKKLNKTEDKSMDIVANIFNEVLFEGRGRPRKDPTDPKWARQDADEGDEADQNIHMQMKKAASVPADRAQNHEVKYGNGSTQKVSPRIANKWLEKHERLKPEGKLMMQKFSQQSHANLMRAIGEELEIDESFNHMGEKEYQTYNGWKSAVKKAHPAARFEGDKDIAHAFHVKGHGIGEWGGDVGSVWKDKIKEDMDEAFGTKKAVKDRNNKWINRDWEGLVFKKAGEEPTCPSCGHHNAMLSDIDHPDRANGIFNNLKCRDCGYKARLHEGRIADAMKTKHKTNCGFPEKLDWMKCDACKEHVHKQLFGAKSGKPLDSFFRNKYKKRHGEIEKNED